jgi:outer membrane lipoprotein-sorting protein
VESFEFYCHRVTETKKSNRKSQCFCASVAFNLMRSFFSFIALICLTANLRAQSAEQLVQNVRAKLDKVNNYQADGKLKTNVSFLKAPIANVTIYYKKPGKLRIINKGGISLIPKGSTNINLSNLFVNNNSYDIIDVGKDSSGLRIIKLLPKEDTAEIILATLYIDEKNSLIKRSKTTTKENGTYELDMTYGKYADWGLPDKTIFSFNTKDYKMPKGVTLDYDDGSKKKQQQDVLKNKKGKVEITYSNYSINQGVDESVFK